MNRRRFVKRHEREGGFDALGEIGREEEEARVDALGEGFEAGEAGADDADVFFDETVDGRALVLCGDVVVVWLGAGGGV
jgi:hypothetical protein